MKRFWGNYIITSRVILGGECELCAAFHSQLFRPSRATVGAAARPAQRGFPRAPGVWCPRPSRLCLHRSAVTTSFILQFLLLFFSEDVIGEETSRCFGNSVCFLCELFPLRQAVEARMKCMSGSSPHLYADRLGHGRNGNNRLRFDILGAEGALLPAARAAPHGTLTPAEGCVLSGAPLGPRVLLPPSHRAEVFLIGFLVSFARPLYPRFPFAFPLRWVCYHSLVALNALCPLPGVPPVLSTFLHLAQTQPLPPALPGAPQPRSPRLGCAHKLQGTPFVCPPFAMLFSLLTSY